MPGLLGIEVGSGGIAVAHIIPSKQGRPVVQSCRFLPREGDDEFPLGDYIDEMELGRATCNAVIPSGAYNLLLAEAPQVEDAELADAMRWTIKDLVDFPLEDAVLDVFRLPEGIRRGNTPMVYVVVTKRTLVEEVIALAQRAGVCLESIDIAELALRNLGMRCADHLRGMAIVQLAPDVGNLIVLRAGQVYLCRQFDIDFRGGLLDPLPEASLGLEIQRSLDYYEHQMGQVPPSQIYLCGEGVSLGKISMGLQDSLAGSVSVLPLGELVELPDGCDESTLTNCIGAIGGALRNQDVA